MAHTYPEVKIAGRGSSVTGASTETITAVLTADAATTARLNVQGLKCGTVYNESGGAVVITYYASDTKDGTALALETAGAAAVTQTVPDDGAQTLPVDVAGVAYLIPIAGSGATVRFHFEY